MPPDSPRSRPRFSLLVLAGVIFFAFLWSLTAPNRFPIGSIFTVPEGKGLQEIAFLLEEGRLVRSPLLFRAFVILLGGERTMQAGQYYFAEPLTAPFLAWRISKGDHRIASAKITVPEGFDAEEISNLFDEHFPFFDHAYFMANAPEGYLFPDTYFVPVTATASSTIKLMRDNFNRKIAPLLPAIASSTRTLKDIVIMASLLEGEVKTKEEREIASGILWKRLKLGMPLQVDSEMGTYESPGLPEKPINNPGLVSLKAAIHPTTTPYLYFLTDKDGKAHYAKDFAAHQANISKYLTN